MTAPLFDADAEHALLGAMLVNDGAAALAASVRRDDLYGERERRVLDAIVRTLAEGAKPDVTTVGAQFGADPEMRDYVATLPNLCPTATNARAYLSTVQEVAAHRRMMTAHDEMGELTETNGLRAHELARRWDDLLAAARPREAARADETAAFLDWPTFWDRDHDEAEWVFPDVLARGRGHALYAAHKQGKSLFMLCVAAELATGREPVVVVYLDYEMTEADVYDRLADMGYGSGSDLSRLHYALLPSLPPLDTAEGAHALTRLIDDVRAAHPAHHVVVILDTIARAVQGEENDADTFRDFYNHTGIELKRRDVTWARLDHSGKDPGKGQRGSSSKGDDVDVVWALTKTENGIRLRRDSSRMGWVPPTMNFGLLEDPLRYRPLTDDWPEGTGETANLLDRLEVSLEASTREAAARLKAVGEGRRRQVVVAALRRRRLHLEDRGHPPEPPRGPAGTTLPLEPESRLEPHEDPGTTTDEDGEP